MYNCGYEELKTFQEIITENTQEVVFSGTNLDEATQAAVIEWFKFRKVCDNEKFLTFFRRKAAGVNPQYESMLRVQTIQFDPMVTQYMERLIDRSGTTTEKGNQTRTTSRTGGNTSKTVGNDSNTVNGTSETTTTDKTQTYQDGSSTQNSISNGGTRSMMAQLPQSSTSHGAGLPDLLNWQYATQQDEQATNNTTTNTQNTEGHGNTSGEGTSITSNKQTSSGTNSSTVTGTNNESGTENGNDERNVTNGEVMKERYTGRSGEAPELLKKAVTYITQTNAFFWLVSQLEDTFYLLYE